MHRTGDDVQDSRLLFKMALQKKTGVAFVAFCANSSQ
uniref:Uncharacterized protein n=1 Tax=Physcomitrium patens TaxID=3218 RepID=A0A2K1L9H2_PHYPA|nr:hypothetical protein PHYPA_001088 [Physcomitrium patens]